MLNHRVTLSIRTVSLKWVCVKIGRVLGSVKNFQHAREVLNKYLPFYEIALRVAYKQGVKRV